MDTAKFINDIVVDILEKNICSEKNFDIGGTKNTLKQCIQRNKGIGKKVITMISNLIIQEIDTSKKNKAINYLKQFLNEDEIQNIQKNPTDIKTIVSLATANFKPQKNKYNPISEFKIMDVNMMFANEWTIEKFVAESIKIDFETIDNITEEHNGNLSQWISIVRENADTLRALIDKNNNMIGYWYFVPFDDKLFKRAKSGKMRDSEITPDRIPMLLEGVYNIYFVGICLQEKYRCKNMTFGQLLHSIIEIIQEMAERKIFINEICAQAYSNSGISLCKSIGLKYLRDHFEHGQIYCGRMIDLINRPFCRKYTELKKKYEENKNFISSQ